MPARFISKLIIRTSQRATSYRNNSLIWFHQMIRTEMYMPWICQNPSSSDVFF